VVQNIIKNTRKELINQKRKKRTKLINQKGIKIKLINLKSESDEVRKQKRDEF